MAGPNSSFDSLASITIAQYSKDLYDNVTANIPLLTLINGGKIAEDVGGGLTINERLRYAQNGTFKWYTGYDILSVQPSDIFTTAQFAWKQANVNCVFSGYEMAVNADPAKQDDIIEATKQNAEDTITNNLGAVLYNSNTESDGKAIGGLKFLVSGTPSVGTVGGIDRSTTTGAFWRNQLFSFATESVTASATTIQPSMSTLYNRCSRNADQPDVIVFGDTYWNFFEASLLPQQQFMNTQDAKASFVTYRYKGAKVLRDPNCGVTQGYFLNSKYIRLKVHKNVNFAAGKPRYPHNQDAMIIPINWMGNLTMQVASLHGSMNP